MASKAACERAVRAARVAADEAARRAWLKTFELALRAAGIDPAAIKGGKHD